MHHKDAEQNKIIQKMYKNLKNHILEGTKLGGNDNRRFQHKNRKTNQKETNQKFVIWTFIARTNKE